MLVKLSFLKGFLSVFFEYPLYYFEQMSYSLRAIYWAISDTRSIAKGDQIIFIWKFAQ